MKHIIQLGFIALAIIVLAVCIKSTMGMTQDQLISEVSERLSVDEESGAVLSYAGECTSDQYALLWFVVHNGSSRSYYAASCEILSNNRYQLIEIQTPSMYAEDLAHAIWWGKSVFLINNKDCKEILIESTPGSILSKIEISAYPYIYHVVPLAERMRISFLDINGNEVR